MNGRYVRHGAARVKKLNFCGVECLFRLLA
jgi:hypothetical protein